MRRVEKAMEMMTNGELSRWLRDGRYRELKHGENEHALVNSYWGYSADKENEPVIDGLLVREDGGLWIVPEKRLVEKDSYEEWHDNVPEQYGY